MFPHQAPMREKRVGQPPIAPQHLLGIHQQGPSLWVGGGHGKLVYLEDMTASKYTDMFGSSGCVTGIIMPSQHLPIMTANHFTSQSIYSHQGQGNISSFVPPQQIPHPKPNFHQPPYNHNNSQIIMAKQTINRNKNFGNKKEIIVNKNFVSHNLKERKNQQNAFMNNEYNANQVYRYPQGPNGYFMAPMHAENFHKLGNAIGNQFGAVTVMKSARENIPKKKEEKKSEGIYHKAAVKKVENVNQQECPAIPRALAPTGTKEKTPMCLVNELARFNKITHQYRLTNEQGPAHKKSFTVTLTLGMEEYTAEGPSIKKAQHSAASEALAKTRFSHPTPKTNKNSSIGKPSITPTVELNALAMKRGEPAVYTLLEPNMNQAMFQPVPPFGLKKRQFSGRMSRGLKANFNHNFFYTVSLKVGNLEFFGEGISPQLARHDAAAKALSRLKAVTNSEENTCPVKNGNAYLSSSQDSDSTVKSPVSLVYEMALKRNLMVTFEVVEERGPPHLKVFVTKCSVGTVTATGEGNGKKISKKRAAINMLAELKKLPPLSSVQSSNATVLGPKTKKRGPQLKKKSKNLVKIVQSEYLLGEDVNPISRLVQIQQLKKEKDLLYTLLEERGTSRKKEFIMEVSLGERKAKGSGPNKKIAKKNAALNLLNQMGYGKSEKTTKSVIRTVGESAQGERKERKATSVEIEKSSNNNGNNNVTSTGGSTGRQLKPGIYVMSCESGNTATPTVNLQTTALIAKEFISGGISPTAEALIQKSVLSKPNLNVKPPFIRAKDRLLYLADLLNFEVQFSDFPKGNHKKFLSLVTISTDPSHVCHGTGSSIEASQDEAALVLLTALSEMEVDADASKKPAKESNLSLSSNPKPVPEMKK